MALQHLSTAENSRSFTLTSKTEPPDSANPIINFKMPIFWPMLHLLFPKLHCKNMVGQEEDHSQSLNSKCFSLATILCFGDFKIISTARRGKHFLYQKLALKIPFQDAKYNKIPSDFYNKHILQIILKLMIVCLFTRQFCHSS